MHDCTTGAARCAIKSGSSDPRRAFSPAMFFFLVGTGAGRSRAIRPARAGARGRRDAPFRGYPPRPGHRARLPPRSGHGVARRGGGPGGARRVRRRDVGRGARGRRRRRGPSRPVPPDGRGRHRAARARGLAVRRERHARDPRGGAGGRVRHERAAGVPVRARRGAVAESGARNERPKKKASHLSARHRGGRRGAFSERGVVRGRPRARRERFPKSRGCV